MPSATSSGADPSSGNGGARSREHNQGNQERKYTAEQAAAVLRIRRCKATAFYEILEVQKTCTDGEIKKAYRKQSLLTHPDKNGHEHADEAFKMVSRAFSVLGDKEKRDKYDRFGTDPDSRFSSAQAQNPFSGFASRGASGGGGGRGGGGMGGGGMWENEMSPEEMFERFFGGGGFGPFGGGFDTGPQYVFNFGGGPGIRVHQFGGARPRARPREGERPQEASIMGTIMGLLPIILLFVFPLLSSLFSGGTSQPAMPRMVFDDPQPPYTYARKTKSNVKYFVDPRDIVGIKDNPAKLSQLDNHADVTLVRTLKVQCDQEMLRKQHLREEAQGWFFQDPEKMDLANKYETKACNRLEKMNYVVR